MDLEQQLAVVKAAEGQLLWQMAAAEESFLLRNEQQQATIQKTMDDLSAASEQAVEAQGQANALRLQLAEARYALEAERQVGEAPGPGQRQRQPGPRRATAASVPLAWLRRRRGPARQGWRPRTSREALALSQAAAPPRPALPRRRAPSAARRRSSS
jgi:hypothetical protein